MYRDDNEISRDFVILKIYFLKYKQVLPVADEFSLMHQEKLKLKLKIEGMGVKMGKPTYTLNPVADGYITYLTGVEVIQKSVNI